MEGTEFSHKFRIDVLVKVFSDDSELGEKHQQKQEEKNEHVNGTFGYNRAKGFLEGDVLVLRHNTATGNLTQPGKSHVGKITNHYGIKGGFQFRFETHGLKK